MNGRSIKKLCPWLALVLVLCCNSGGALAAEKPNVVIFLTDDQGMLDVNCYGSTDPLHARDGRIGTHVDHGPTEQGFDEFFGNRGGFIHNTNHYFLHGKGFHDLYEGEKELFMKGEYYPGLITKRALQFVDQHKDEPFLLYMGFNLPHYPEPERKDYLKEKPGIARRLEVLHNTWAKETNYVNP